VDIREGHKTGFYLDQRVNRSIIRRLAANRDVLDCFSYTGGFAVNAVLGNASTVTAVEISESTIEIAWANCRLNQIEPESITWANQDVFQFLRTERDRGNQYDLIILDPPKFAPTASHVKKAARGYKDINLQALKLLRPGGLLATFSCSGGLKPDLFQKIVADAALDANANGKIIQWLHQSEDHPVALSFPEGEYLKGLIVQKV
ncbi:MAG: methyltransferase domain-containing protein, partial [candidate division Zixibacteria bacterium]|nr:class I SAM-dependent rRNA methyltransferase [candidate division Zixibacteria bacterium]NIS44781.1 class I SAM-dependent rRNA methyltransferase [candidate division Zixibacteria bacterium]NIU12875.1 class I SAM-dependent rRNA methyltransferase [candidate division Zixibacteria bacterium]NIV04946.1 methyltransferase domain-containing protein [candidate division Zixibacteria bacterium]NIW43676.1 methyltransferase domain-containing protein [Gammaproteobacteria bacterium]